MLIFYSIILCLSAWLVTYLLMRTGARVERLLALPEPLVGGYVALVITLAMMVVVAAPSWVILLAIALTGIAHWQHRSLIPELLVAPLLAAGAIVAVVMAVFGGPHWLVIDIAILSAALGGVMQATRSLPEFRSSAAGFVTLQIGLFIEAALRGALHAS